MPASRRWAALAVLLSGTFLANLDVFIVVVALPAIHAQLGATAGEQQLVLAGYELVYAVGLITGGRLGDVYGRFRVFGLGMGLFTVASVCCALAPAAELLVGARLLQGAGTALLVPQVYSLVQGLFEPSERARAFAATGAVMGAGAVGGQLIGGFVISADVLGLGWRAVFWVNIPIGVAALVALPVVLCGADRGTARPGLDLCGVALAGVTLFVFTLPLVLGRDWAWPWWMVLLLAASVPLATVFIGHELRVETSGRDPLMPVSLLRRPGFGWGLGLTAMFNSGLTVFFWLLALDLQQGRGMNAFGTGVAMLPLAAAFAVTSLLAPRLSRGDNERVLVIGAALAGLGYLATAAAAATTACLPLLLGALTLVGAGQGLVITPMLGVVLRTVPGEQSGAGAGLVATAQQLGAALGVCLFGLLFYGTLGRIGIQAAFGLTVTTFTLTALTAAVMTCHMRRAAGRPGSRPPSALSATKHPERSIREELPVSTTIAAPAVFETELFPMVATTIDTAIEAHTSAYNELGRAVRTLARDARCDANNAYSLPLLVCAAETGYPNPALPVAAVHSLWWQAANLFDDIADDEGTEQLYGLSTGAALMAALELGHALPVRIVSELPVPEPMRAQLLNDFFAGWTGTNDGQIRDILHRADTSEPEAVLTTYRHKSSSAYVMATTMAARLAGADKTQVGLWRKFATELGLLCQFRNDQEDLDTGRLEDLKNQTATYLLVALLDSLSGADKTAVLSHLQHAGDYGEARQLVLDRMLHPQILRPYLDHVERIRTATHHTLGSLRGIPAYIDELRRRVEIAAHPSPLFTQALADPDATPA